MASVLKQKHFLEGQNVVQAEVFNWEDVAARARSYLETVRLQAAELIADAKSQSDRIRQQANDQGVQQGTSQLEELAKKRATAIASQEIAQAMNSIEKLAQELEQSSQHWLRQWQYETIPLAIAIAEKIISRQIDLDPEILMHWIVESVRMIHGSRRLELRMHPTSIQRLEPALSKCLDNLGRTTAIDIVPDESIEPHGVLLQNADGKLDMRLSTQLARLQEEIQ